MLTSFKHKARQYIARSFKHNEIAKYFHYFIHKRNIQFT